MGRRCRRHHRWSRCASWAVCDSKTQRLWVIAFVCAKPDGLMSVGPLRWTGQNEIFGTKCCEMLSGNTSLMSWFVFSLEGGWGCASSWSTSCAPSWLLSAPPVFNSQLVIAIYIYIAHCIWGSSGELSSSSLHPMSRGVGCALKSLWAPDAG